MAEALRKAIETFAAAPQVPRTTGAASGRAEIVRNVKRFERRVAQWCSDMLMVRRSMLDMYKGLSTLPSQDALQEQLRKLDEFITIVAEEIESEWLALEQSDFSTRQTVSTIMKTSADNARFAKKFLKRLHQAGISQHEERLAFYKFLTALRTEYTIEPPNKSSSIMVENQMIHLGGDQSTIESHPFDAPVRYSSAVHALFVAACATLFVGASLAVGAVILNVRAAGIAAALTLFLAGLLMTSWLGQADRERSITH